MGTATATGLVTARRDPAGRLTTTGATTPPGGRWPWRPSGGARSRSTATSTGGSCPRADGVTRRWDRDAAGVVVGYAETGPAGESTTTLRRDAAGRVVEAHAGRPRHLRLRRRRAAGQRRHAGRRVDMDVRRAGRLVGERGPDGETAYDYDGAHQLVRCTGRPADRLHPTTPPDGVAEDGPAGARRSRGTASAASLRSGPREEQIEVDVDALGNVARFGARGSAGTSGAVRWPSWRWSTIARSCRSPGHAVALAGPGGIDWLSADWRRSVAAPDGHALDLWGAAVVGTAAGRPSPAPGFAGELDLGGPDLAPQPRLRPCDPPAPHPDPLPGTPGTPVAAWPYHYGSNDPVGHVDPLGPQALTIDQYEEYRAQETSVQWSNIAMVGAASPPRSARRPWSPRSALR